MSVVYSSDIGFYVSHEKFILQCYKNVTNQDVVKSFVLKPSIFKINNQFTATNVKSRHKKRKLTEVTCESKESNASLREEVSVELIICSFFIRCV